MNNGLHGVVPCKQDQCINIAVVRATRSVFDAGYFCKDHVPVGWQIVEGELASSEQDILRRNPYYKTYKRT